MSPRAAVVKTEIKSDAHPAPSPCLIEPAYDSILLRASDLMYRMKYEAAESLITTAIPQHHPARAYFRGLILSNRFNDLGDTSALFQADAIWESLVHNLKRSSNQQLGNDSLYQGLATLQLSYVANITGHGLRAANLGRSAVEILRPLAEKKIDSAPAEAVAALALYDYYKAELLKGVKWLPFVTADEDGPRRRLESAVPQSRYLREILQTSLLWLYYDAGEYDKGLALIDAFLARYPDNRLYRQMQGDFKFRRKDYAQAKDIQEKLNREYADLRRIYPTPRCLPIGYLSSEGNLAKIYSALGQADLRETHLAKWSSPELKSVMDWIPSSLKREVKTLR